MNGLKAITKYSVLALGLIGMASPAFAQVPGSADAGRVDEHLGEGLQMPDVSPRVQVRDLLLQSAPQGAESIKFTLKDIQVEGASVYSEDQIRALYSGKIGQTVSLAEVYDIAATMTNKYRNEGYILTQVVVPPQTIDSGTVRLQVVEGYVDSVSVEGNGENGLDLIRQYAGHIKTGGTLNVRDLERYLLLINDLPGVEARSVLSPSATKTGAADLQIVITRDPYDALLSIDNFGSRYLGPVQLSAAGSLNSFFGNNERITAQIVDTPDPGLVGELAYLSLAYEQPIMDNGTTLEISGSTTHTEPGYDLDQYDVRGKSQYLKAQISHPFIRSRSQNLVGYAMFDWRDVRSRSDIAETLKDNIRAIRVGGNYEFLDTLFGVGINAINLEVARGLDVMGASDEGDPNLTRGRGDPTFTKATAAVKRVQRVTSSVNLMLSASGQLSSNPLLSSEEFGVGGINVGRGYDPSEIVGDDGVAGTVEVQWTNPYPVDFTDSYQLYSFYDAGHVWNQDATTSSLKSDTVTSAGLGVRAEFPQDIQAGLALAFPLNRDVQTQGDRDPKLYFNLSKSF